MSQNYGQFPAVRMRRTRQADWCRRMVEEHRLSAGDLIFPLFIQEGSDLFSDKVSGLPGVARHTIKSLLSLCEKIQALGIPAIALFPMVPADKKNGKASEAVNGKNLLCRAVREIKKRGFGFGVIGDIALDPYTDHGHDGIVYKEQVDNDKTLSALCAQALVQAEAGCDILAPSDMMDGRIGAIRKALDKEGHSQVMLMSYAAKYASAFYGPFRSAIGSEASLGKSDKRSYQMSPANSDEALREVALDVAEGADMLLIKPGMAYLDILYRVSHSFAVPTFAYQVSGEYAMIQHAAKAGCFDAQAAMLESLLAFKRAGARGVFTYGALDIAEHLRTIA